jgi:hypothetical protein
MKEMRSAPQPRVTRDDLGPAFFEPVLAGYLGIPGATVVSVAPLEWRLGSSILMALTAAQVSKLVGLFPVAVRWRAPGGRSGEEHLLLKVKPLDDEIIAMVDGLARASGARLAEVHPRHRRRTGFAACDVREIGICAQSDPRFVRHTPRVTRLWLDEAREACVLAMELLEDVELLDAADDLAGWTQGHVEAALRGAAELHAIWLDREAELLSQPWLGPVMTTAGMVETAELWEALAENAHARLPALVDRPRLERLRAWARSAADWWPALERGPRTLVHGDFNPRNVAFRRDPAGPRLCAWDWELATLAPPSRDVAELLAFTQPGDVDRAEIDRLLALHRLALEEASGVALDPTAWRDAYRAALRDLALDRFGLYLMAHAFQRYPFLERTIGTLWRLLDLEGD